MQKAPGQTFEAGGIITWIQTVLIILISTFIKRPPRPIQLYYIPETLEHAGITHQETQLLANMGIGFVKVILDPCRTPPSPIMLLTCSQRD